MDNLNGYNSSDEFLLGGEERSNVINDFVNSNLSFDLNKVYRNTWLGN